MANTSRIKSAERTLEVLTLLADNGGPLTSMEIAEAVGMPKSTTHHLLNVMSEHRFLSYQKDQRVWGLGVAALEIGTAYQRNGALVVEGQKFLQQLTTATGAASHLAILQGPDVIYLDKREPQSSGVRLVTEVGTRLPAHLTAVGRAILSRMDPEQITQIYEGYAWPTRTGHAIRNLEELNGVLTSVRESSVSIESNSTTQGISCIAGPVMGGTRAPIAAIGIAYLSVTQSNEEIDENCSTVREIAQRFSDRLSARPHFEYRENSL